MTKSVRGGKRTLVKAQLASVNWSKRELLLNQKIELKIRFLPHRNLFPINILRIRNIRKFS